ncbi:hypothetical protein [Ruegeria atlantica]|uniref:Lipoprotein n=1 Tax=Ruegeria atlantica TaxID=81569 RepID=A0A0P1E3X1_9RHOB|nr:hypothetical protein [Ruegeria atlantica]CUH41568.1 hypothetical protein RUM4293_00442 [Ruegeria atlantica]
MKRIISVITLIALSACTDLTPQEEAALIAVGEGLEAFADGYNAAQSRTMYCNTYHYGYTSRTTCY